ncbi:PAS domain-containing protein [Francisella sp. 19X1-34]|uniref:PAS domain-containing protein n=1 Tax=Francisella sp. 19X1-34 TaxID=3087177 RepID=UPI002E33A04D|nr:PAS domain-containing protein [Francisella sp. 19X1-34]MED7789293.1 PAS domain-containing protein [Francisella sp. 19X1-34]
MITANDKQILLDKVIMQQKSPFFIKDINGKYIYINHKAAALADLSPEDFIGFDDLEIFGADLGAIYRKKDQDIISNKEINPIDIFTDKKGVTRAYFILRQPIYDGGRIIGVSGIRADISDYIDKISTIKI